jgi:transcriptional regulator with XRE-family HTH domain
MNHNQTIGSNIKELRKRMGLNQDALAKYLEVHREVISYYENGSRTIPVEELMKLTDLFGCELSDLLNENPQALNACLAFAFRANELQEQDLESIAEFKKVVKNYLKLIKLQSARS